MDPFNFDLDLEKIPPFFLNFLKSTMIFAVVIYELIIHVVYDTKK